MVVWNEEILSLSRTARWNFKLDDFRNSQVQTFETTCGLFRSLIGIKGLIDRWALPIDSAIPILIVSESYQECGPVSNVFIWTTAEGAGACVGVNSETVDVLKICTLLCGLTVKLLMCWRCAHFYTYNPQSNSISTWTCHLLKWEVQIRRNQHISFRLR